jgi:ketosteroid isomerase-like protein
MLSHPACGTQARRRREAQHATEELRYSRFVTSAEQRLRETYDAFNARDIERVLAQMTADVDWPNAWEGGRVVGREAVREYWTRQWAEIDPHVEPTAIAVLPDGRVEVEVHQVARTLDGAVLVDGVVRHTYAFRAGLIERMDVSDPAA